MCDSAQIQIGGSVDPHHPWIYKVGNWGLTVCSLLTYGGGKGRKPGASSYTRKRLSLSALAARIVPIHTRRILLVYIQCTHSPHPPPWHTCEVKILAVSSTSNRPPVS
jgi:hypothetical protein